jgi:phage-related baseplate assembly protein
MAVNLPDPVFISSDPAQIVAELVTFYETQTGLTLSPAQVERLLVNAIAYREALLRSGVNEAAKMNLLAFSVGIILDYLVELVGVKRLPAAAAICTIEFTLVTGHGNVVIPMGTRVATLDGKGVFRTKAAAPVAMGTDIVDVDCEAETAGSAGNGYAAGNVNVILDPQSYLQSAANTDTTLAGADKESDEQLRTRAYLAPASFGTAGSEDGYKYWARVANQLIIDVEVDSQGPLYANIYPLIAAPGGTPQPILDQVYASCSPKNRRPMNDLVIVESPQAVNYNIDVDIVLFNDVDQNLALQTIQSAAQVFASARRNKLGRDVIIDQLKGVLVIPGMVYSIVVNQPTVDSVLTLQEYAECGTTAINITGFNNG